MNKSEHKLTNHNRLTKLTDVKNTCCNKYKHGPIKLEKTFTQTNDFTETIKPTG